MKKNFFKSLLTIACLLCSIAVYAYDFEVDGIYYDITNLSTKTVDVTSGVNKYAGSVVIPESVTYNGSAYSVTSIDNSAFHGCTGLTEVSIPNSVTSIGSYAFEGCTGLTSITIPNSVTSIGQDAFSGCTGLTEITIPNSVTSIGDGALQWCDGLTEVTIGNSVTSIGNSAFHSCTGLTEVSIPNSVTSIGQDAFSGCTGLTSITIPNSVTSIGGRTFYCCTSLAEITIPNSVTSIGSSAFYNCSGLTAVTIGNSVTSIGESAFYRCTGLTEVTIPNSVTSIGSYAFEGCTGLTSITIPNSVTTIGRSAFYNIDNLTSVTVLATVPPTLGSNNFGSNNVIFVPSGCGAAYRAAEYWKEHNIIDTNPDYAVEVTVSKPGYLAVDVDNMGVALKNVTELIVHGKINSTDFSVMRNNMTSCYSIDLSDAQCDTIPADAFSSKRTLKKIVMPAQYKVIGDRAFADCILLSDSITFPEGLVSIGSEAFKNCKINQAVVLPNSVTTIGNRAFYGCSLVKSVILPKNLTKISNETFCGCSQLCNVSFPTTIETIGDYAFRNCTNMTLVDLSGCEKLSKIGNNAFSGCSNVTTLNLPASLQSVGTSAFADCNKLANISLYATTPPTAGDMAFNNVDNYRCLLSYPTASHVEYLLSAHWGAFIENRKSIDVSVDTPNRDENEGNGHFWGGYIWYDRDWHKHHVPHHGPYHAPRRAEAQGEESVTITGIEASIGNGLSLKIPTDSVVTFLVEPEEGYTIGTVHYGGMDVTDQLVNGVFTTSAVNANTTLDVVFIKVGAPVVVVTPGDANGDNEVNISDVVSIVNYILGDEAAVDSIEAADVVADGEVNISDVVAIVNSIMSGNGVAAARLRNNGDKGVLAMCDVVIARGESRMLDVTLDNSTAYTAYQADITIPNGMELNNIVLSNRLADTHSLAWRVMEDGTVRMVVFSHTNTAIAEQSGTLFTLDITATDELANECIAISNAIFTTKDLTTHLLDDVVAGVSTPSSIGNALAADRIFVMNKTIVIESTCQQTAYIVTASGMTQTVELQAGRNEIEMMQQGLYIVVTAEQTEKVIIR